MELNKHLLNMLALGLGLAATSCGTEPPATQQTGTHKEDIIKKHPELSKEDTANVPVLYDPNNCPACGMG